MAASVDDIFGIINFLAKYYTVSDICYDFVLWMYDLCNIRCSMYGPMYHTGSLCGDHNAISFGLF